MLGDFGISKIVNSNLGANTAIGTIAYAAPEQVFGSKEERYDERVDIYSLGLTLYQLANSGKMPFAKKKLLREEDNNRRLAGEKIARPDGVGNELGNAILKAIEYLPEKRYQTAKDFLYALSHSDKGNIEDGYDEVNDIFATKAAFSSENVTSEDCDINFKEQSKQEESKTVKSGSLLQDKDSEILVEDLDELIQLAADMENPEIEYRISNIYRKEGDEEKELNWLFRSAEHGYSKAQYRLGVYYYSGSGVEINIEESRKWLWKAANQNDSEAMWHLGMRYFIGDTEKQNLEMAATWFWKAALTGHESSKVCLIRCFVEFSKEYMLNKGFYIDDSGVKRLKDFFADNWKNKKSISFSDTEEYLDMIITNVEKSKLKLLKDIILHKRGSSSACVN